MITFVTDPDIDLDCFSLREAVLVSLGEKSLTVINFEMECDVLLHHLSNSIIGPPVTVRFHVPTLFQMEYAFVQRRKVAPCYSKGGPLMEGLLLWRPPSCSSTIVEQTSSQGQCFWNPNGDALEKILRGKFPF